MGKPLEYHPGSKREQPPTKKNPIRIASMHNSHIAVECYNVEINDASPIHPDFFFHNYFFTAEQAKQASLRCIFWHEI